jgi:hypothetical protein
MDSSNRLTFDPNQTDQPCEPEMDRLAADTRRLWEIREHVRLESERSVIQRAWDVLLGPSRDKTNWRNS